jgi:protein-tyrosine phosphatase
MGALHQPGAVTVLQPNCRATVVVPLHHRHRLSPWRHNGDDKMRRVFRVSVALAVAALATAATARPIGNVAATRSTPDTVTLTWDDPHPVDVYVADRPDATIKTATRIATGDVDGRFDYADGGTARRYFLLRDTAGGPVMRTAERQIPLTQGSNFRDIGGYPAAGGKQVRYGLIYRSGATPVLTDADVARIKALGLKNIVDLRSSEERLLAPTRLTGIPYTAIDYSMLAMMGDRRNFTNGGDLYRNFPAFLAPHLRIVFDDLLAAKGPIVYHCSAGQDRTGFATAMVLSALGVPRDVITADYHLSTADRKPEFELPKIDAETAARNPVARMFAAYQGNPGYATPQPLKDKDGTAFLDSAFAEIEAKWGSVDHYLEKAIGLTKADRALLRATYLE